MGCEDKCDKSIPQLNIIGSEDEYFGNQEGSMSYKIQNGEGGYGGPLTGNCRAKYDAQSFTTATVVEFEGAGHGPSYWNDNTMRSIFADFMTNAGESSSSWKSLEGCKEADGVYTCPIGDASPCMPGWALNADAEWTPSSVYTCPADDEDGGVRLFQASKVLGSWRTSPPIFAASMAAMIALLVATAVGLRRGKVQMAEQ